MRENSQALTQNTKLIIYMKKIVRRITERLFGRKYYAVIIGEAGSDRYDLASQIHPTRCSAMAHRRRIEQTRAYMYVTTISFRTHHPITGKP